MNDSLRELERKIRIHRQKKRRFLAGCCLILFVCCLGGFAVFSLSSGRDLVPASGSGVQKKNTEADSSPETPVPETAATEKAAESESKSSVEITVSLMGDCTLGTDINFNQNTSLNAYYASQGAGYFFRNVKSVLEYDDLSIVNMEGTLTDSEQREDKQFAFKGDPEFVDILTEGSVEAANLANNHSHDYGTQSFEDTRRTLEAAGIHTFGYDSTQLLEIKGIRIGLLGIYELADHLGRKDQLLKNLETLKSGDADIIIAVFHWGNEKETSPDTNQTTLAHLAVDNGADLVVGHHSHVLQPVEKYKGKYIAYSLGNFCFGGNSNPSDKDTAIFQTTFSFRDQKLQETSVDIIPCRISSDPSFNNYQPTPVDGEDADRILEKLDFEESSY